MHLCCLLLLESVVKLVSWQWRGTFAGMVAIAAGIAGQKAECREFSHFCHFHASTFCVFGQQELEDFLWRLTEHLWCGEE